jgi:Xanthosine triphosphate pyrophosphatase
LQAGGPRLVLATGNAGKWREFQALLQGLQLDLALQSDWNVSECPEPHATFIENALAKARHAPSTPACLRWPMIRGCAYRR